MIIFNFLLLTSFTGLTLGRFYLAGGPGVIQSGANGPVYDHLQELNKSGVVDNFRLSRIEVMSNGPDGTILGLTASYVSGSNVYTLSLSQTLFGNLTAVDIAEDELIVSFGGSYRFTHTGQALVHHLSFNIQNGTGSREVSIGTEVGKFVTESITGPIVAFRLVSGGSFFAQIGAYVDPASTYWTTRGNRIVKGPLYGASVLNDTDRYRDVKANDSDGPISLIMVDHNNASIFSLLGLFYSGITSSLNSDVRFGIEMSHFTLNSTSHIASVKITTAANCVSGLEIGVFMADSRSSMSYTFGGSFADSEATTLAENAIIPALFGIASPQCITGLGLYIGVPLLCPVLDAPENGVALSSPPLTEVGSSYTFACNSRCMLNGSDTRVCTSNLSWTGNLTDCSCLGDAVLISTETIVGLSFGFLGFFLVIVAISILALYLAISAK